MSDAPSWLLPRYGTIVVASELQASSGMGAELTDKLRSYVLGGGRLVITAGSVRALTRPSRYSLFGIEVGACRTMPAGTEVRVSTASNTSAVHEAAAFELCEIGFGGAASGNITRLAATTHGSVLAAARVDIGAGSVTLLASPFGIPAQAMQQKPHPACEAPSCTNYCQGCPDPAQTISLNDTIISEVNAHLFNPFPLLAHAEAVIGDAMAAEKIFDAGEGLSVAVNRRAAGAWTVSVTNPSVTQLDLKLVSHVGKILSVSEISLDTDAYTHASYTPMVVDKGSLGRSTPTTIAGSDMRMFFVKTQESGVEVASDAPPPPRATNRALSLPRRINSLRDALRDRPSFFQSFDTVLVDWELIERSDPAALRKEAAWLVDSLRLRIVVDMSNGMRAFPELRLVNNSAHEYAESMRRIAAVIDKLPALGCNDLVVSLHMMPEATPNFTKASDDFAQSLRFMADRAKSANVTVHLRHQLKLPLGPGAQASLAHINQPPSGNMLVDRASLSSVYGWLDRYRLQPAIRVAVGASLLLLHGMLARDMLPQLGNASMIMLSTPATDQGGIWTEHGLLAHANAAERPLLQGYLQAAPPDCLLVLDAAFADTDEEYGDAKALRELHWG